MKTRFNQSSFNQGAVVARKGCDEKLTFLHLAREGEIVPRGYEAVHDYAIVRENTRDAYEFAVLVRDLEWL